MIPNTILKNFKKWYITLRTVGIRAGYLSQPASTIGCNLMPVSRILNQKYLRSCTNSRVVQLFKHHSLSPKITYKNSWTSTVVCLLATPPYPCPPSDFSFQCCMVEKKVAIAALFSHFIILYKKANTFDSKFYWQASNYTQ